MEIKLLGAIEAYADGIAFPLGDPAAGRVAELA